VVDRTPALLRLVKSINRNAMLLQQYTCPLYARSQASFILNQSSAPAQRKGRLRSQLSPHNFENVERL